MSESHGKEVREGWEKTYNYETNTLGSALIYYYPTQVASGQNIFAVRGANPKSRLVRFCASSPRPWRNLVRRQPPRAVEKLVGRRA